MDKCYKVLRKKALAAVSLWKCLACLKPVLQCVVGSLAFKPGELKCDAFDTYVGRFIKDNAISNDNGKERRKYKPAFRCSYLPLCNWSGQFMVCARFCHCRY